MAKKIIYSSLLILVILISSFYILFQDKVRVDILTTKTEYSVNLTGKFELAATEYVNLYDGTTKMRADSRELSYSNDSKYLNITRISKWKDNITTVQTYIFDYTDEIIENFPLKNEFTCINCNGKIVQFEIRDIEYNGETKTITGPFLFGKNMKIEWQGDSYYSKVFQQASSDKIIIKYKPTSNYSIYLVRLYDPNSIPNMPIGEKSNNIINLDGTILNVSWEHVKTNNLNSQEFILAVSQLANSSTAGSAYTISPYLYLVDSNFNLSDLPSDSIETTAYQYAPSVTYHYNLTKTLNCINMTSSDIPAFQVSYPPYILYQVGDQVSYNEKYYECKQQIYNYNGVPTSLTQYWKEITITPTGNETTWNYPECLVEGNLVINNEILFSEGSQCTAQGVSCSIFNKTFYNPVQIGSSSLNSTESMFKNSVVVQHENGIETQLSNLSLYQLQVPDYTGTKNDIKYFNIKINNIPIDRTNGISTTGTFLVDIGGNLVWDKTHSSWWNETFIKKRQINITENSGATLTDYSTLLYITYDADMQADFDDLRFLNSTEDGLLSYWIENKTDSTSAWVWVKIPTLTASSNTTIYMYYSNSDVSSTSNCSNTFLFCDLMIENNTAQWTSSGVPDATSAGATSTLTSTGDGYNITGSAANRISWIYSPYNFTSGKIIISADIKMYDGTQNNQLGIGLRQDDSFAQSSIMGRYVAFGNINFTATASSFNNQSGTAYDGNLFNNFKYIFNKDNNFHNASVSGAVNQSVRSVTKTNYGKASILFFNNDALRRILVKNYIVRTYSISDPIYYIGDEETPITDSCTYSGTGDWLIQCSDYCNLSTNTTLIGSLLLNGTGNIKLNSTIGNITSLDFRDSSSICNLILEDNSKLEIN